MTLTAATLAPTIAAANAARNWAANLRALAETHPSLVERVQSLPVSGEWILARDGSLTLLSPEGKWLADCSLPYRAGVAMLKSLDARGTVACFLSPNHAAEIRAGLERFSPQQAVIVLSPDLAALRTMLACEDFSAGLESQRLFFAAGKDWASELRSIFEQHPGLPTPQQFIKLPTISPEVADPLIAGAQPIFAAVLQSRAERISAMRDARRAKPRAAVRIGVLAGSRFALWDDAGAALAEALRPASPSATHAASATKTVPANGDTNPAVELRLFDPDTPINSGPLATAIFCRDCDAVVTADSARCDFQNVLPLDLPWVTWVTKGRVPAVAAAGPHDALIVADATWRQAAIDAGWPASRVAAGAFRALATSSASNTQQHSAGSPSPKTAFDGWTILADTIAIEMPKTLDDFSSHRLLWEAIAAELATDPFAIGQDVAGYLQKRAKSARVDESTLDHRLMIDLLIMPAFQQAIVRAMRQQRLAVRAFGRGWGEIEEFRPIATGEITSRDQLITALASSKRLVHLWPLDHAHPIDAAGLPVLRRGKGSLAAFLLHAKRPEAVPFAPPADPAVSLGQILSLLSDFRPPAKELPLY